MLPRLAVAIGVAVVAVLALSISTGLLTGHEIGAADNGDGIRLYCGSGLRADTPSHGANWKGGVVLQFLRMPPCHNVIPSSSSLFLRVAVHGYTGVWSLTVLAWWYIAAFAVVAGVAAWAATRKGLWHALILLPAVAPLAEPAFSRFLVSTYSEPTGLLGMFAVLCGVGVVAVTGRSDRVARWLGLVLVAGGGLLAATAKVGYLPILGVAALFCVCTAVAIRRDTPRLTDRIAPIALAAVAVIVVVTQLPAAQAWQLKAYGRVNAQDLVYTTVLNEVPGAAQKLGLPQSTMAYAGDAYFPDGAGPVPGISLLDKAPNKIQKEAVILLVEHPGAMLRTFGIAMQATEGRSLTYLPSAPWTPATVAPPLDRITGEEGATTPTLAAWLNGLSLPWWPSLVTLLGIAAAIFGWIRRGGWTPFTTTAGVASVSGLLMAIVSIFGDGYFEIAKHVWLTAYCVDVTVVALVCAVVAGVRAWLGRNSVPTPQADVAA